MADEVEVYAGKYLEYKVYVDSASMLGNFQAQTTRSLQNFAGQTQITFLMQDCDVETICKCLRLVADKAEKRIKDEGQ